MPQNALFITLLLGLLQITKAFELHRSQGSYLINASRGTVVDLKALARALNRGHIAGAAVDVFEKEPEKNGPGFQHPLQGCPNTILTPHIGGSTVEAQANIGEEVAAALIKLVNHGATINAVNFPNLELPYHAECHRILNIHVNKAGVLRVREKP
mmetsp:Transcript_8144/g.36339  ORF Transcript_8144/g.36339 Transcript_8144/m.36339 type:complete len:155 (-) Transcript_8144:705-1169(-)